MKIMSRTEAQRHGLKRYFTGKSCLHGHIAERYVSCRTCVECFKPAPYNKSYQDAYRAAHTDEKHAYNAAYYAENAAQLRQRACAYRRDNAIELSKRDAERRIRERTVRRERERLRYQREGERKREREARRYQKERDRIKARVAKYRKDNPEKVREINRICGAAIRCARKQAPGKFTRTDVLQMLVLQNGKCNGCGLELANGYDIDHILPLSRGGTNWPENLQLLCRLCNQSKGAKTMEEWLRWLTS